MTIIDYYLIKDKDIAVRWERNVQKIMASGALKWIWLISAVMNLAVPSVKSLLAVWFV